MSLIKLIKYLFFFNSRFTSNKGSVIVSGVERALFIREKGLQVTFLLPINYFPINGSIFLAFALRDLQKLLHDVVIDTFRDIPESMGLDHNSHDVRFGAICTSL